MTFWNNGKSLYRQAAYSFQVELGNKENANLWYAKSVVLPAFEQEIISDLVEGRMVKSHGPSTWQPVVIELYDIAPKIENFFDPSITTTSDTLPSTSFMAWATANNLLDEKRMKRSKNYQNAAQHSWYDTDFTEGSVIGGLLGGVRIRKIYNKKDSSSRGVEEWVLEDPIMVGISFGNLDVSSEETLIVSLTFEYQSLNYTIFDQSGTVQSSDTSWTNPGLNQENWED
tara:strand:+ start:9146 stop:9829 length:684 start_codon:yes stop_codon:yes gene_type:complete